MQVIDDFKAASESKVPQIRAQTLQSLIIALKKATKNALAKISKAVCAFSVVVRDLIEFSMNFFVKNLI